MFILLIVHPLLRKLYEFINPISGTSPTLDDTKSDRLSHSAMADARMNRRMTFDSYFSIVYLTALHGVSALKVLLILYTNFTITTRLPRHYIRPFTWIFNICILFANELCKGYPLTDLANFFLTWSASPGSEAGPGINDNWGSMLDNYGGLIPRWEILFKITILRLISFNLDYCWSVGQGGFSLIEVRILDNRDPSRSKTE